MDKYFKPIHSKIEILEQNKLLFNKEETVRKQKIIDHVNSKYDCVDLTNDSIDNSPSITSPYFNRKTIPKAKSTISNSKFIPKKRKSLDDEDNEIHQSSLQLGNRWPKPKKIKYSHNPTDHDLLNEDIIPQKTVNIGSSYNSYSQPTRKISFTAKGFKNGNSLSQPGWAQNVQKRKNNNKQKSISPSGLVMKSKLTQEQKNVIILSLEGKSMFFTGSAGTGKSFVLQVLVNELKLKYGQRSVFVTASTGLAGCNIQGTTLHYFAGIGIGKGTKEELLQFASKKSHVVKRWRTCSVLVIDEISMISADFFTKIEYVARKIRKNEKPFGGIQLILCGDFFQLPPVQNDSNFCFESEAWKRCIEITVELKQIIRQSNPEFIKVLNEIRIGELSKKSEELLKTRINADISSNDGIIPTKLYPHRRNVSQENRQNLIKEKGNIEIFNSIDRGDNYYIKQLDSNCQAPKVLELKLGCQVMLLKNIDYKNSLVNGSRGIVIGFEYDSNEDDPSPNSCKYPLVRFSNSVDRIITTETWSIKLAGEIKATRDQIPLTLAYALSIHKSQGMSIERVKLSLENIFAYGQAYVALSRVTTLEGLSLTGFTRNVIRAHPRVKQFYSTLLSANNLFDSTQISSQNTSLKHLNNDINNESQQVNTSQSPCNILNHNSNSSPTNCKVQNDSPSHYLSPKKPDKDSDNNISKEIEKKLSNITNQSQNNSILCNIPNPFDKFKSNFSPKPKPIKCGSLSPKNLPLSKKK